MIRVKNTGGMGAYSPSRLENEELDKKILEILDMNRLQRKHYIDYCYRFSKRYQIKKIIPLWKSVFNF